MEYKLKGILEILEEENKKKGKGNKEDKVYNNADRIFPCEKKESSSFNYIKPKYLIKNCKKNWNPSVNPSFDEGSYFDYIRNNAKQGKDTIELYLIISSYANYRINNDKAEKTPKIDLKYVQKLIDNGADVNFINNFTGNDTCLLKAVQSGDEALIRLLLKNGANPNIERTDSSISPIFLLFITFAEDPDKYVDGKLLKLFRDFVEKNDADIYDKDSNGKYLFANLINSLDAEERPYAKSILGRYGFKEEDFEQEEQKESLDTKAIKDILDFMNGMGVGFEYTDNTSKEILETFLSLKQSKEKTKKSSDKKETKKSDDEFEDTFKIPEELL